MIGDVFYSPFILQIRNASAVGLFIITDLQELRRINWSDSNKTLKNVVQEIRLRLETRI